MNKFRVFNKRMNRVELNCNYFISTNGGLYKDTDPNGVDMSGVTRIIGVDDNYVVQKYTSLLSCSGKGVEIYEGDIISVDEVDGTGFGGNTGKKQIIQHFDRALVKWNESQLAYFYYPIDKNGNCNCSHQNLTYGYNVQVIGNIEKSNK